MTSFKFMDFIGYDPLVKGPTILYTIPALALANYLSNVYYNSLLLCKLK
jgi:hypothetical protein